MEGAEEDNETINQKGVKVKSKKLSTPKLVYGVGINDADYVVKEWETIGYVKGKRKQKIVWECPYYRVWVNMLKRCYSTKYKEIRPTYEGCVVSDEWLTFSNFKSWMDCQDWEGKQLDKDILFERNKIYSADTCVFVTPMVNSFTTDSGAARGEWMIGVNWYKGMRSLCLGAQTPSQRKMNTLATSIASKKHTKHGLNVNWS